MIFLLLNACTSATQSAPITPAGVLAPPAGLAGSEGVLLWASTEATLEVDAGDGWQLVGAADTALDGQWLWWMPGASAASQWRLSDGEQHSAASTAEALTLVLSGGPSHGMLLNHEPAGLSVSGSLVSGAPEVELAIEVQTDTEVFSVEPACLSNAESLLDCAGDAGMPLAAADWSLAGLESIGVVLPDPTPLLLTVQLRLRADATVLSAASAELIALGRDVAWGDLHAHSNLSNDGCEDPENFCEPRGEVAAEDMVANAVAAGLDSVAFTEHAEWTTYVPGGDEDAAVDIWQASQDRISEAEGIIALLGYEWTYDDRRSSAAEGVDGGHKTVILESPTACDAWRIGATRDTDPLLRTFGEGYYTGLNSRTADSFAALWAALDAAAAECDAGRAITFTHHPAYTIPEETDWTREEYAPDPFYETVIEIHSEHGSSECVDIEAEGCDWNLRISGGNHFSRGAVQSALSEGYRLGFVAGTDSHDARPGSLDDGPSCLASWKDEDGDGYAEVHKCLDHPGALTGLLHPGTLERADIFDAIAARQTLATSGPRLPPRAIASIDGALVLPGGEIPAGSARIRLGLTEADLDGGSLIDVALVLPDNTTAAWTDALILDEEITTTGGDVFYLRVRLEDADGAEQRVWISPWFVDG